MQLYIVFLLCIIILIQTVALRLSFINRFKLKKIMAQLDDLKAKVQAQSTALGSITTNVDGIKGDVAALKQQIADLIAAGGGATPEEVAELAALVDGVSSQIDAIGTATASLDAETP